MTRCTTTSGPHRCEKPANHDGECECEAAPYCTRPRLALPGPPPVPPPQAPTTETSK